MALGLAKPGPISGLKFSKEAGKFDLWIDVVKETKFPCPVRDRTHECHIQDTQERTWRHIH